MSAKQLAELEHEVNALLFGGSSEESPTLASRVGRLSELLGEVLKFSLSNEKEIRDKAREVLIVALKVFQDIEGNLSSFREAVVQKIREGIDNNPLVTRTTMLLAIEISSVDPTFGRCLVETISKELLEYLTLEKETRDE